MEKIVTEGLVLAAASVPGGSFSLFHNLGLSCWFFSLGGIISLLSGIPVAALPLFVAAAVCYKIKQGKNQKIDGELVNPSE